MRCKFNIIINKRQKYGKQVLLFFTHGNHFERKITMKKCSAPHFCHTKKHK